MTVRLLCRFHLRPLCDQLEENCEGNRGLSCVLVAHVLASCQIAFERRMICRIVFDFLMNWSRGHEFHTSMLVSFAMGAMFATLAERGIVAQRALTMTFALHATTGTARSIPSIRLLPSRHLRGHFVLRYQTFHEEPVKLYSQLLRLAWRPCRKETA